MFNLVANFRPQGPFEHPKAVKSAGTSHPFEIERLCPSLLIAPFPVLLLARESHAIRSCKRRHWDPEIHRRLWKTEPLSL